MKPLHFFAALAASFLVAACGTRTDASVTPVTGAQTASTTKQSAKSPNDVLVTESDITNRKYVVLGDIEVTVSKWTIFDADPTPEKVAEELKQKAAALGADAVVLVRYGTVGIGMFTWGKLEGRGRAVAFTQ